MDAAVSRLAVAKDLGEALESVRRVRHQVPPRAEHGRRILEREYDRASIETLDRMDPESELHHDSEVRAAAPQGPEELRPLLLARPYDRTVCADEPCAQQVVERQAEGRRQVPDPAAERQAGDARVAERPTRHRQPVPLAGRVNVLPQSASSTSHRALHWIDRDLPHQAQIHDEAAVAYAVPGDAVTAASHGHGE